MYMCLLVYSALYISLLINMVDCQTSDVSEAVLAVSIDLLDAGRASNFDLHCSINTQADRMKISSTFST